MNPMTSANKRFLKGLDRHSSTLCDCSSTIGPQETTSTENSGTSIADTRSKLTEQLTCHITHRIPSSKGEVRGRRGERRVSSGTGESRPTSTKSDDRSSHDGGYDGNDEG
jgi:hypothetical protein